MLTDFGVTYSHLLFYVPTEVSAALELIIMKDSLFAHLFVLSRGRVVGQLTSIMMMTCKLHKKVTLCRLHSPCLSNYCRCFTLCSYIGI